MANLISPVKLEVKTRTGKDVLKEPIPFVPRLAETFSVASFEGLRPAGDSPVLYFPETVLQQKFRTLRAEESHFGGLPRIWSRATAHNRMIGEPCAPLGRLPQDDFNGFYFNAPLGLNFKAKGAFWPHDYLQVPQKLLQLAPTVLTVAAYMKKNLPDARLWPAVDLTFKISAGMVPKGKTGLDPFLKDKQATLWHTDGDDAAVAKIRQIKQYGEIIRVEKENPPSNALALIKQRMIISNAVPTSYSDSWEFVDDSAEGLVVKSNGYPARRVMSPVTFAAGTPVTFTNNNMHTANYATEATQRTVMIVSGTIYWGSLRKLLVKDPDIIDSLSTEAPPQIHVPERWGNSYTLI